MFIQKFVKFFNLLGFSVLLCAFLCGCEAMDNILSSAGVYKINALIDGVPLEECSYVKSSDNIDLSFEESVSDDPDVSSLMVYLKNASGDIAGRKVVYTLDDEEAGQKGGKQAAKELFVSVKSLDDELPSFQMPENLAAGKYTLSFQVMKGKDILQKTEKNIYYLGRTDFSYDGINVYLPGAVDTPHLVPKESVVMLEANLDFDSHLNPYIIWYDGKNKIGEGKFSDGAASLFWKTPEQNGFFSLCAEVFPAERSEGLSGYKKEISLLVSSGINNIHLVSANIDQLTHWYIMEGNLNNSKNPSADWALKSGSKNKPKWMGLDGAYGLATGCNNVLELPKISIANKDTEIWQTLFRFKSLNNGVIFSVQFDSSNVSITLSIENKNLVLTLNSPQKTISQTVSILTEENELYENVQAAGKDLAFLVAGVKFSVKSGLLSAHINIIGNPTPAELAVKPITLEVKIKNEFNIMLGFTDNSSPAPAKNTSDEHEALAGQIKANTSAEYNVLWDEFALYYMPPIDILTAALKPVTGKGQQVVLANK
jgi:hypothetical protein